jgi:hypothetical protein
MALLQISRCNDQATASPGPPVQAGPPAPDAEQNKARFKRRNDRLNKQLTWIDKKMNAGG